MVPSFKYLGRVLSETDDDCTAVIWNLAKAWAFWSKMTRILRREEVRPQLYIFSSNLLYSRC